MRFLLAFMFTIGFAASASACTLQGVSGANEQINPKKINVAKMSQVITAYTNLARCQKRRKPLAYSKALTKAADGHAKWMGKNGKLTHTSTKAGHKDLRSRFKKARVKFRTGAENIAQTARLTIPPGETFRILDAGNCKFQRKNGQPIVPHTYDSLGKELVRLWVKSKGHNKNLMDRKFNNMGAAVGYDAKGPYCGAFYAVQVFSD